MKIALVYPPTCDPTAPYLAVPALTGFLRANGVEVLPAYGAVTADFTSLPAAPGRYRVRAGEVPVAVRGRARGRRPPNSPNALG